MLEKKIRKIKGDRGFINAKLGMGSSSPFLEEPVSISYLQVLGDEVDMGIFQALKCTNPENEAYVIELPANQFGVRFLYPRTINQVDTKNQVLFYIEGQIDPKEVFKKWVDGQIILEKYRHKILLDRYDSLIKTVGDIKGV